MLIEEEKNLIERCDRVISLPITALGEWVRRELSLRSFPYLLAITFLFYFSALSSFPLSIDDELSAVRDNTGLSVWLVQGRWTIFLIERLVISQPTIPYLPNALFCLFIAAAYIFMVRAHGLVMTKSMLLVFPLFCAFPIWDYITEFYANTPAVGLGIFLLSVAACLFRYLIVVPVINRTLRIVSSVAGIAVPAFLLAVAIGAYQSFIFAFASIGLGVIILTALQESKVRLRETLIMLAALTVVLVAGLMLYSLIQQLMLHIYGLNMAYIDSFWQWQLLLDDPGKVIGAVLHEMRGIYSGSTSFYGASLEAIGAVMILGALALVVRSPFRNQILLSLLLIALALAMVLAPFSLNIAAGGSIPLRSLVGVPYVVWFFAVLALSYRWYIPRLVALFFIGISIFQVLYLLNLYAAYRELTQTHDQLLAADVYRRIADAHPDFDRTKNYSVDFFGAKPIISNFYPYALSTTINASFFAWDGGNPFRIISYMKLIGYDNLLPVERNRQLQLLPYYADMPVWPITGSVRVIDGITLVKLGPTPGVFHRP